MSDLIDRQAAIDAFNTGLNELVVGGEENAKTVKNYLNRVIEKIKCLPSAQPERIIYANMSDEEFEKWLYEHGICNPNIHEPIPCDVVPLLIDNAISELPSAQPEIIRCKDCKCWVPGYITDNDDFIPPKCGEWQQMVGHSSDDYCSLAGRREVTDGNHN